LRLIVKMKFTGLERTAQIITRAALLLVAVMVGFASADMLLVKELGVGMAIAAVNFMAWLFP